MISHGDELGRTQSGNNNAYCHDGPLTWIDWKLTPPRRSCCSSLAPSSRMRAAEPAVRRPGFFSPGRRSPDRQRAGLAPAGRKGDDRCRMGGSSESRAGNVDSRRDAAEAQPCRGDTAAAQRWRADQTVRAAGSGEARAPGSELIETAHTASNVDGEGIVKLAPHSLQLLRFEPLSRLLPGPLPCSARLTCSGKVRMSIGLVM